MRKTFIVAEAGINHCGDLDIAKSLVDAAKDIGVDAIKFQTYTTEKRVDRKSPIWDILKQCELSYDQFSELKEYADNVGIEFFSTPFHEDDVKFLIEDLSIRRVKISSFDMTNHKFLNIINQYAKKYYDYKVIISTGMANFYEIREALEHLNYVAQLTILYCKSSYPLVNLEDINLSVIRSFENNFHKGCRSFGYSDHSPAGNIEISSLAVVAGASTIERHFTLDYNNSAIDNKVSLDITDFKKMIDNIRRYEVIMGESEKKISDCERQSECLRRFS